MKEIKLSIIVHNIGHFVKGVDFNNLPERDSEEYRELLLKTANDEIFNEGPYSPATDCTVADYENKEVRVLFSDLKEINALKPKERKRIGFYKDLLETCLPLYKLEKPDWTAWPWNMKSDSDSMENEDLFSFLEECKWPNLAAAVLNGIAHRTWLNEDFYSSVARQEASNDFEYGVKHLWESNYKSEEEKKELPARINKYANDLWFIENHMLVGRMLGFDWVAQSVYDAFDTYIDRTYRHNQVRFALELGAWINANWTLGEPHPDKEKVDALRAKTIELKEKYGVSSPDIDYSWNILLLDVLGMSLFAEE